MNKSCDNTLWQSDDSLRGLRERLRVRPDGLSLVTFDFFDTIVSRLCAEPSDLFIEVARQLRNQGLLNPDWSPEQFRAARIAADERARDRAAQRGRGREVELASIYEELVPHVVTNAEQARATEFLVERGLCYINPAVISLARHARTLGCKIAVVSDTYLRASELMQILNDNGVERDLFDAVIVSCENRKAKWNGQLYHDVLRQFNVHPSEMLHIGDNEAVDIRMAASLGIEGVHYYKISPTVDCIFEREEVQRGVQPRVAGSLNSLRVQVARKEGASADAARDGAMVFGPVLSRFIDWSLEEYRRSGVKKVLALMREGELLGEMLSRAATASGIQLEVLPCYASRLATAMPSLPAVNAADIAELIEGSGSITPQTILDILGIGSIAAEYLDSQTREAPLYGGEAVAGFLKLILELPRIRCQIEDRRKATHSLAFEYLSGLTGQEAVIGVLDLGWSASIQRNIGRILRNGGSRVRTLGCYLACTARSGRLALDGDSARGFFPQEWNRSAILPEVAITACVGSTDGYKRGGDGRVLPVLGGFQITPQNREIKQQIRRGILDFQTRWLELLSMKRGKLSAEMLKDIDSQCGPILFRLLDFPTKPEADRLGSLNHDENYFGKNFTAPLCDDASLARLKRGGVRAVVSAAKCYWPQGILAQANPRLASVLGSGWKNLQNFNRFGAWTETDVQECGITADELSSLVLVLKNLGSEQVIYCGLANSRLVNAFANANDQCASDARPKLVLVGPPPALASGHAMPNNCAHVLPDADNLRTFRRIRSLLLESDRIALVFDHAVPSRTLTAMLQSLGPFLGARGVILVPAGIYDARTAKSDCPAADGVQRWIQGPGAELAFEWVEVSGEMIGQPNWNVAARSMKRQHWYHSWELAPGDFPGEALATTP